MEHHFSSRRFFKIFCLGRLRRSWISKKNQNSSLFVKITLYFPLKFSPSLFQYLAYDSISTYKFCNKLFYDDIFYITYMICYIWYVLYKLIRTNYKILSESFRILTQCWGLSTVGNIVSPYQADTSSMQKQVRSDLYFEPNRNLGPDQDRENFRISGPTRT